MANDTNLYSCLVHNDPILFIRVTESTSLISAMDMQPAWTNHVLILSHKNSSQDWKHVLSPANQTAAPGFSNLVWDERSPFPLGMMKAQDWLKLCFPPQRKNLLSIGRQNEINMHREAGMRFRRVFYLLFECLVPVTEVFRIAADPKNHSSTLSYFSILLI